MLTVKSSLNPNMIIKLEDGNKLWSILFKLYA
jgi:predicted transcriptional regulator